MSSQIKQYIEVTRFRLGRNLIYIIIFFIEHFVVDNKHKFDYVIHNA